jgi:exopolysaccharide biosynthesis protein
VYSILLTAAFVFILLDAFVIPRPLAIHIAEASPETSSRAAKPAAPVINDSSYSDENITIQIETIRRNETTIFIAGITVSNAEYLKTAFAKNTFGRNISETTSSMAAEHHAILAINGDYYGFRETGYVLRNGALYRNSGRSKALVMDTAGNFSCKDEADIKGEDSKGAWQIWSFGPALVLDGETVASRESEVTGRSAPSNPRTAIGQAGPLHYIVVVSNGRTPNDRGLSLLQLAELFRERGCSIAYNLDGGGSSCLVFNGEVLNNPTTYGNRIAEREISDIIYIGYE